MTDGIAWHIFQCLVFILLLIWTAAYLTGKGRVYWSWTMAPVLGIVLWGVMQLSAGWSVYPFATSTEVLRWLTYAAILFLSLQSAVGDNRRTEFRRAAVIYSLVLAVVSVFQYFMGNGKIFWLFTPPEPAGLGPFLNRDHYASFIALMLPIGVVEMITFPRQAWFYGLAAAVLYASAVAGASRAGFVLLTLELILLTMVLALPRKFIAGLGLLIVLLGFVVGWETLYRRIQAPDPYAKRREVAASALEMFQHQPVRGFGLGSWRYAYPAYAGTDLGVLVNSAHNDWLQWAVEGGIPGFVCCLGLFVISIGVAKRAPWAIGVPVLLLHSAIDFPMQGRFLPAIVFLLLGMADTAKQRRKIPAAASGSR